MKGHGLQIHRKLSEILWKEIGFCQYAEYLKHDSNSKDDQRCTETSKRSSPDKCSQKNDFKGK